MDTILSDMSPREKLSYLRTNGQRIRDALTKATILDPKHHYVLIKNPGQALREQE